MLLSLPPELKTRLQNEAESREMSAHDLCLQLVEDGLIGTPKTKPLTPPDHVYFIQAGEDGPIKIGATSNPPERLLQLQRISHISLKYLLVIKGGYVEERQLHEKFAAHRKNGEWFAPHPDILGYITIHKFKETYSNVVRVPLTPEEKLAVVDELLHHPEWSQWSDSTIARHISVSANFLTQHRQFLDVIQPQISAKTPKFSEFKILSYYE